MRVRIAQHRLALCLALCGALGIGLGCAGVWIRGHRYDYFATPGDDDAWSPKIGAWQRRERSDARRVLGPPPAVSDGADAGVVLAAPSREDLAGDGLRSKYFEFRAEHRRRLVRDLATWIQAQAQEHYVADGPVDHWATLEETLSADGDDCDGLELLVFHALRDLGFSEHEVYRAIVYRPSDGQHHMVTLWFEDPEDPWVIDPTGAMIGEMRRMSDVPDWVPLKVFSDTAEYTVRTVPQGPPDDLVATR